MTSHTARRVAAAVARQAPRKAAADPKARGADWRTAVVATVGTNTITTTDGIPCRRLQTYQAPVVGDQVVISRSGNGNWLAMGRAALPDGWSPLPLASGWTAWGSPYWTPGYRINDNGTASLCGLAKAPASTTGNATVGTLPAAAIPPTRPFFPTVVNSNVPAALEITSAGAVQITNYSGTAAWAALDVATYRLY
ncbi:hypothetical protein NMG29_06685 [Streptomyces cocklensis]|uniref:Uncharacterized protein n=1 Tax=Actinacidiphila cocklensis TaxID=887465 RepID=A0A9W4DRQ2_9ACTN|nr:hypothetical protein [Actinacidiphila cocklensis]MDD1057918.1 hypothetical protein [Actinacidiphila cocklensis]CAG6392783.1 conserved hypothetical protein [Actinacidiphila cocklensis]